MEMMDTIVLVDNVNASVQTFVETVASPWCDAPAPVRLVDPLDEVCVQLNAAPNRVEFLMGLKVSILKALNDANVVTDREFIQCIKQCKAVDEALRVAAEKETRERAQAAQLAELKLRDEARRKEEEATKRRKAAFERATRSKRRKEHFAEMTFEMERKDKPLFHDALSGRRYARMMRAIMDVDSFDISMSFLPMKPLGPYMDVLEKDDHKYPVEHVLQRLRALA